MRGVVWGMVCLLLISGCSGKASPEVRTAAEQVLSLGGTFTLHGATIPVKKAADIPPGSLPIRLVNLNGLKVRDVGIEPLKNLTQLEELHLQESYLTDAGLAHLQGLKQLKELDLHKSLYITDKGLESLGSLSKLSKLELSYTKISDGAINALLALKGLKSLHLTGTRVTTDGLKRLREGLPRCEILK